MTNPFEILSHQNLQFPKTVIQVGASGGQEINLFKQIGITSGLFIEALDFPFSILCEKVSLIPNFIPLKMLVTNINAQTVNFHVASNSGMSSSMLEPKNHLINYPDILFSEKISLVGYRLDYLFQELSNRKIINFTTVDMLYLDVQGAELSILKSAGQLLESISYVWTEVGCGDGYENAAKYTEIINYLDLYGFQMIYFNCAFEGFGDALFVKKKTLCK